MLVEVLRFLFLLLMLVVPGIFSKWQGRGPACLFPVAHVKKKCLKKGIVPRALTSLGPPQRLGLPQELPCIRGRLPREILWFDACPAVAGFANTDALVNDALFVTPDNFGGIQ